MNISVPDILFGLVLLFFTINGFRRGLITEISRLTGLFAACFIASKYHIILIPFIEDYFINEKIIQIIAFLILFFLTIIIINILSSIIQKLFEFIYLGWLNRLLGSLIGFIKGLIIISVIIFCMGAFPEETINKIRSESIIYKVGTNIKDVMLPGISYDIHNTINFEKMTKEFETINIPGLDSLINK